MLVGNAEEVIAARIINLDIREHPVTRKQLSNKRRKALKAKIKNRTATKEEYRAFDWDRRFARRRREGVNRFWKQEAKRIIAGEKGTRNWTSDDIELILSGKRPRRSGKALQAHHTFSAILYPHLANRGEIIYPATHREHFWGWHGGNYRKSIPGKRIRKFNEF